MALHIRRLWPVLIAVLFVIAAPRQAHASTIAMDFTPGDGTDKWCANIPELAPGCMAGWGFNVSSAISVVSLGVWDEGGDGLFESHQVGLWTSGGSLLALATVTNASTPVSSTGPGRWLFTPIAPLVLSPGSYVIGAAYTANDAGDHLRFNTIATTIPQITLNDALVMVNVSGLVFPTLVQTNLNPGLYGPDFQVDAAPVPEPASVVLLTTGILVLVRRRQSRP